MQLNKQDSNKKGRRPRGGPCSGSPVDIGRSFWGQPSLSPGGSTTPTRSGTDTCRCRRGHVERRRRRRGRGVRRRHLPAAIVAGSLARTVASQRLVIRSQPGSNCYCYAYSSFTRKQNYFGQALGQILGI